MRELILAGILILTQVAPVGVAFAQQATQAQEQVQVPPPAVDPAQVIEAETGVDLDAESRTLGDWYAFGGWVIHVIVFCSVIGFTLILERLWSTRRSAVISRKFLKQMRDHWNRRELPQVLELCRNSDSAIARVLRVGLVHLDQGLAQTQDAIEAQTAHESTILRRNLPLLAALGNIATMLGLLGTVLGMIESFDLIAKTGTGDARVVAGGIFTALVTTAAGLIVGITMIAAHAFFRRRVDVLEIDLSEISMRLLEDLVEERSTGVAAAAVAAAADDEEEAAEEAADEGAPEPAGA